ncbi:MAG: T9SS type A sorting domain-containing protein, partial [Balneolaceae bacterium]
SGFTTLKVYDALGREVATLVNGLRTNGTHSETFNASALSSGVYFYVLKSGDFIQTQKMLLVK